MRSFLIKWLVLSVFLILITNVVYGQSENATDSAITEVITAIEIPKLTSESNVLIEKIKRSNNYLESLSSISESSQEANKIAESSLALEQQTTERLESSSDLRSIKELGVLWERQEKKVLNIESKIESILEDLETQKDLLEKEKKRWVFTKDQIADQEGVDLAIESLDKNILRIDSVLTRIADSTNSALEANNALSGLHTSITSSMDQIKSMEEEELSSLFSRTENWIWSNEEISDSTDTVGVVSQLNLTWKYIQEDTLKFIRNNQQRALLHILLFVALMVVLSFLKFDYFRDRDRSINENVDFVSKPLYVAFFISVFTSFWLYKGIPVTVVEALIFVNLIPIILLLPVIAHRKIFPAIYLLTLAFLLEQISSMLGGDVSTRRWVSLFEGLVGIVGFVILSNELRKNQLLQLNKNRALSAVSTLIPLAIVLLAIATLSNIRGNVAFAYYLVKGVTYSSVTLLVFYVTILISEGILTLLINARFMQKLKTIQLYKQKLLRNSKSIVQVICSLYWVRTMLVQFGLFDSIQNWYEGLLSSSWEFGVVSITLSHFLDGVIVIVIATLMGSLLRTLLKDEILPRFNLKRGLPAAVGITSKYLVVTIGFFLALASLGIDLEKLGFIAGALSLGIGFGLQNIVGNFISGLILLFERPVVKDDIVQIGEVEGTVLEIGLRSSKVKTWEGAEVIIPNMDLISKQVTNLTLSDKKRRLEKIVLTEKDAKPSEIIESLNKAIKLNQEVLSDPAPQVLYLGQESNYFKFRVLYWVTGNVLSVGSDVSIKIDECLTDMDVRVAIPESKVSLSGGDLKNPAG